MQDKLQEDIVTHQRTHEPLNQHLDSEEQAEWKIVEMREEAKKQKQWFENQLPSWSELVKQAEQTLKDEINRLEDIHAWEATLWKDIKLQYEARPGTRGENQPSQNVPRRIPGKDGNGRQAH